MSIAEKLTIVAENMQRVYNAGKALSPIDGVSIKEIWFENWHSGTYDSEGKKFEHGLKQIPQYVAIIPTNVANLDSDPLDDTGAILYESDACVNTDTGICYGKSATRRKKEEPLTIGSSGVDANSTKGIYKCDSKYVYVNALAVSYKWPPKSVTSYIMICIA